MYYTEQTEISKVVPLLEKCGLSMPAGVEYTAGIYTDNGDLAATGSLKGDMIQAVAVDPAHQGEDLMGKLLTHLIGVASERGLVYEIKGIDLGDAHPNSVKMKLVGENGKEIEVVACSVGGGQIQIREINGLSVRFSGDYPTLIIRNQDIPGQVQQVTSFLANENVNIGTMQLYRSARGADAVMVIECDKEVPDSLVPQLEELGGIVRVTYLSLKDK